VRGIAIWLGCALALSACGSDSAKGGSNLQGSAPQLSSTSSSPAPRYSHEDVCKTLALYESAEDEFLNESGVDPYPGSIRATPTELRERYDAWTAAIGSLLAVAPSEIARDVHLILGASQRVRPVLDGISWNIASVADDVDGRFDQAFNSAFGEHETGDASNHLSDYYAASC
jgi:hypothetical protein